MKAGIGERVAGGLTAPETLSDAYDRMLSVAQNLQVAVGAVALVAVWVLPPYLLREQLLVTALLLGVYLPWSLLSRRVARLAHGPVARVLNLSFDLAAVGSFALVIPTTRTAVMFAYVLVVAFHAYVSGRVAGLTMTTASLALVALAEWRAPVALRHDAFTLVMYGVVLVALALMVDALAGERRRTARHLGRLHRAIESLAAEPSLSATTDSIAEAAKQAVHATAVMVLLPRSDLPEGLQASGGAGLPDELRQVLEQARRDPVDRAVCVPDLAADERFAWAAPVLVRHGARSLVTIPLGSPSEPLGVLNAYFPDATAFDDDDIHLLNAYGRQASVTVARALAFEQERRASARLAAADQLKSDFVSTVSHELRTPLTSISGFVDTVLLQWDRLDDAGKKELLQRAAWNTGELRRLIEQVLTFSSLEREGAGAEPAPYELRRGIDRIVERMSPALRDCRVVVDIEPDLVVLATPEAMQHVIGNLLTNASKFSPAGSLIRIEAGRDGAVARIAVTDEGPGVAASDRDRIFDRFYRGATTGNTRGTGIGLAIVRTSVEALGGEVDLRDQEAGGGATFEVRLPLADEGADAAILLR